MVLFKFDNETETQYTYRVIYEHDNKPAWIVAFCNFPTDLLSKSDGFVNNESPVFCNI